MNEKKVLGILMKQNLTGKLPDSLVSIAQLIFLTKLLAPPSSYPATYAYDKVDIYVHSTAQAGVNMKWLGIIFEYIMQPGP